MDPVQAAIISIATFLAGIAAKWAVERFLKRGDEAEKKAEQVAAKHAEDRETELDRKLDLLLLKVGNMELAAVKANEQAISIQAKHEELRERINGGLKDHAGRIRVLEEFRVEVQTRFKMMKED